MKLRNIALIALIITGTYLNAQSILDNYIQEGLENNLALKQKDFSYRKSTAVLKEARGMFLPSIGFNSRYTLAGGGRTIDFPVGDLMNPVYSTLNQLTGQQIFPTIENQKINFLREKEHDTRISIIQPLFRPDIYFNYKIRGNLSESEKAARDAYAVKLIGDIKSAYYNILTTQEVLGILQATQLILDENLRISKSLYKNDKATINIVYRAEAELLKLQQRSEQATSDYKTAKAYFNFLINRNQDEEVITDTTGLVPGEFDLTLDKAISIALNERDELDQIEFAMLANSNNIKLNKSMYLPTLLLAADYGYQGKEYNFSDEHDYWTASLVLQWNLFKGFQDKLKIEQAEWDKRNLDLKMIEVQNQIRLQVRNAYYNLQVVKKSIKAASAEKVSAEKSFEIIRKKFREGMASQIEFIDARTTLTNAEINSTIIKYKELIKLTELEMVISSNASEYKLTGVGK